MADALGILALARLLKRDPRQIRRAVRARAIPKAPWPREIVPGVEALLLAYEEAARAKSNGNLRGEAVRRRRLQRAGTAIGERVAVDNVTVQAEPLSSDAVPHQRPRFFTLPKSGGGPVAI